MNIRTLIGRKNAAKRGIRHVAYNFKPHNGGKERTRRLRQILTGKLEVSPEEYQKAMQLWIKLAHAAEKDEA